MSDAAVTAYIDGGARGNPGPAGYGVRIEAGDGALIEELNGAIGVATNNVAEYRALLAALTYLDRHGYRNVVIRSDSELLTKQMRGQFKVRHARLQPLHRAAGALVRRLGRVRFEHVPRSANTEADRLANAAMDGGQARRQPTGGAVGGAASGAAGGAAGGATRYQPTGGAAASAPAGRAVIALGVDIESIERVGQLLERYGPRFVERVFTAGEAEYSLRRRHPAQHLAARFAAKEAAMKALGTGRSAGVLWRGIEVVRAGGPPQLRFHDGAARRLHALGGRESLISMSHSGDFALAQVLLLGA